MTKGALAFAALLTPATVLVSLWLKTRKGQRERLGLRRDDELGLSPSFGVGFTGRACSEPRLIEIAYGFEQATGRRVAPPGLQ